MNVLVTGGAGFIGSNFIRYLIDHTSWRIINFDKLTYAGNLDNLKDVEHKQYYRFIYGDVADKIAVSQAMLGIDTVVHFAAESHNTRSEDHPDLFYRTNVEGTRVMLECAKSAEVKLFIHVSTDEVYGPIVKGYFKEEDKRTGDEQATSAYSKSKALADDVAQSFFDKLPVIVVRPTNNFGPNQYPEKALPRWVTSALDEQPIKVWGDGKQVRDWLFVDDTASAIVTLIKRGRTSEVYNIGANHNPEITNLEMARRLVKLLGKSEALIEHIPDPRPDHDARYGVSTDKIRSLGWQTGNFAEQLEATVKWYKENQWWWRPLKDEAERLYANKEVK